MVGKTISHYKIIEKLGEGGIGIVYKAKDLNLDRLVALKFLSSQLSEDEDGKTRFIQEAKTASALDHPNICTIHEVSQTEDGQLFIAMAYYEGETLKEKISHGSMEMKVALHFAIQIASGLDRAHQNSIVHRDIKPANVVITDHGEAKILDFGLAKLGGTARLTRTGTTVGTAAYMSPEQIKGVKVDHRSDIFSWAVVFYEMLTGQLPFHADYEQALMYAILEEEPKSIRTLNPDVPEELELILNKALAKNPDDRYQQTAELMQDLQVIRSRLQSGSQSEATLYAGSHMTQKHLTPGRMAKLFHSKRNKVIAVSVLAALVILALTYNPITRLLNLTDVPDAKHIAVLPFSNIGEQSENQALCDGLVATLTSKLSQLEQFHGSLWVVPASEVRKSSATTASEALQLFGANLVITGSVQWFPNMLRLSINLIDAESLRQLASRVIDEPFTTASVLQDEAVVKLSEMLNLELQPETRRVLNAGATTVPGAYEFYLQGRGYLQNYHKLENIDASIKLFERALNLDSEYALAYAGLGEAYLRKFQLTNEVEWIQHAETNCKRALEFDNLLAPARVTQGLLYTETGRYQEAINEFQEALELDPASAAAYRGRARAFLSQGKVEEAEATYKKAISIKPDYWGGYNALGVFYFRQGRYEEAIRQFQHVIELTPQNAKGYRDIGSMYYQLNRSTLAIEYYRKALEISPDYSIYANLATIYYYEKQYENAARMYEKALELRDTDYRVWGYLGSAYKQISGEKHKAQQAFRNARQRVEERLKINPNDPSLLLSLAGYHIEIGERDKALSLVDQAIALDSKEPDIFFRIASIYEQLNRRDQALVWIEKALSEGYPRSDVENYPIFADLLNDKRYQQIIEKLDK